MQFLSDGRPPGSNRLKMQEPLESSAIFESVVIAAQLAFSLLLHLPGVRRRSSDITDLRLVFRRAADVPPLHMLTLIELNKSALFLPLIFSGTASG